MSDKYFVYFLSNKNKTVLYTGITNKFQRRLFEHKNGLIKEFTNKYNVHQLMYFEIFKDPLSAISREKQIKAGSRKKKIELIKSINPNWDDLSEKFMIL